MIRGVLEIRDAYRSTTVAEGYVQERFREPLGALLHDRQVSAVAGVIAEHEPGRILEIAPGPARLTRDVASRVNRRWTILDASAQMLGEARRRLDNDPAWQLVQGDAFALPVAGPFDLVYSFRFVRHFEIAERQRIYREVVRVLRPGGLFVFDAVNEIVSAPMRAAKPQEYAHYDALLDPEQLRRELKAAGLDVVSLAGVQHRYPVLQQIQNLVSPRSRWLARRAMAVVDAAPGGSPLEWIVVCRRV